MVLPNLLLNGNNLIALPLLAAEGLNLLTPCTPPCSPGLDRHLVLPLSCRRAVLFRVSEAAHALKLELSYKLRQQTRGQRNCFSMRLCCPSAIAETRTAWASFRAPPCTAVSNSCTLL